MNGVRDIMNHTSFYTNAELEELGLQKFGSNVQISRKCSIYSPDCVSLGDNVRIDDFCILTGRITIGSYIHISAYVGLFGKNGIVLNDFSNISMRSTVLSATDDFSGEFITPSPVVPEGYSRTTGGLVVFEKHANVGAHCLILPNLTISEGTAVGAMSLITKSTVPWMVYVGIPAKPVKERKRNLLELERRLLETERQKRCSH